MLNITNIQIEHMENDCVTDRRPRISFALESDRAGERLKRAEIAAGDWKIETRDQLNIPYGGEMKPFTSHTIQITAQGTSGETAYGSARFCFGRLQTPWAAKWITDLTYSFPKKQSPRPLVFKKNFPVKKNLRRAWVNASALGIYELRLNGQKVGKDYFAPGFTSYAHQIQYQTYDVTQLLAGDNQLIATVAGGWAAGSFTYNRTSHISCDRQAFLCELHLEYDDDTRAVVSTDKSWLVTQDSPFLLADWYDGETYNAEFCEDAAVWRCGDLTEPKNNPQILAQYGPPVRSFEKMQPVSQTLSSEGELVYDFGQNFAGVIYARIKRAAKGQTLVFRHTEVLVDGKPFVKPLRSAKARATYICKDGAQEYSPRFTYMGFRYVGVKGIAPQNIELTALVLHSDVACVGKFSCSNPKLNRLNENIRWSGFSNFVDIPTDCPQRDERMGWTGDAAVFASTACFHFDMSRFYDKWLLDVNSEQGRGGAIPMVVPRHGDVWPVLSTACWGDCCVLVPWAEYLARGDKALLKRQYPTMKKFLKAAGWWSKLLAITPNGRYIWRFPFQFGDWCAPESERKEWMSRGREIATAYFANSCLIAEKAARILEENADADAFLQQREKIIKAYRAVFTDGTGRLKKEFQSAYILPLYFGMVQGDEQKNMAAHLNRLVHENGNHLATGFPSTPYLLFALSDYGYLETAYNVLLQETCPGWLYEVLSGGTTVWERWDALRPDGTINMGKVSSTDPDADNVGGMVSFNHYANGAVGDWLYRRIAGIEPTSGGYRTFRIAPMPGGGLTEAAGKIRTPFGLVSSHWKLHNSVFSLTVLVPVSTQCELVLPSGATHTLQSGRHWFECSIDCE